MSFPSNLVLGAVIEKGGKMCLSNRRVIFRQKGGGKGKKYDHELTLHYAV